MAQKERFTYILEQLDHKGRITVSELCHALSVSEMTIRSDLNTLAGRGLLKRIHGGAEQAGESLYKGSIRENLYRNAGNKIAIAREACGYIHSGDAVIVDDSSTCLYLVRQLKKDLQKQITIYTNSVLAAAELLDVSHIRTFLLGGELSGNLSSTFGPTTELELSAIEADLCFLSPNGISEEHGASVIGYSQMKTKQSMMKASRKTIFLADSHKFGKSYLSSICSLSDIALIITDNEYSEEIALKYQNLVTIKKTERGASKVLK